MCLFSGWNKKHQNYFQTSVSIKSANSSIYTKIKHLVKIKREKFDNILKNILSLNSKNYPHGLGIILCLEGIL
jgi:hypothetical protein